jgi:hypothetical protein
MVERLGNVPVAVEHSDRVDIHTMFVVWETTLPP